MAPEQVMFYYGTTPQTLMASFHVVRVLETDVQVAWDVIEAGRDPLRNESDLVLEPDKEELMRFAYELARERFGPMIEAENAYRIEHNLVPIAYVGDFRPNFPRFRYHKTEMSSGGIITPDSVKHPSLATQIQAIAYARLHERIRRAGFGA